MDEATAGRPANRIAGYAPIEDYGAIGDGRTVALIARDGRIDWMPLPAIDSPPAFAALLDPEEGGCVSLQPSGPFTSTRRYLPDTNVLETTFTTDTGVAVVTDALAVGTAGPLPWGELIRRIDGVRGHIEFTWSVQPGTRFGDARPWTSALEHATVIHLGDQHLGVLAYGIGKPRPALHETSGRFILAAGEQGWLAVVSTDAEPLFLPGRAELDRDLQRTIDRWREWSQDIRYDGRWRDSVVRSALALKLLLYTPTGAIAAAPTTSLPERLGGDKNYDYRYMWVRDSSFTVDALLNLRLHEEVQSAVSYLLSVVRRTAPKLHVFYTLGGEVPGGQAELSAAGYRHSTPVRAGNSAADQLQLGTFGDLFDTVWHYVRNGHVLDSATGRLLVQLADQCCDLWRSADAGIWELDEQRQYTVSKIGCWVALDRAVRLAEVGALATEHAHRWKGEAAAVHDWVNENCWSDAKNSYTFYAGTEELDAATLIAGQTGFDRGERLAGTVAAVRRELAVGPLVYRYSGMDKEEGTFLACTFWLANALLHSGDRDGAIALMDEAVQLTNDVGLLSEQQNPEPRYMLGNFPQGLSHLALINTATAIEAAPGAKDATGG